MSDALRIALVSPHAWPPRDDVAHHVAAEARALAGRGHRVTILAPSTDRALVAAGRALLLHAHSDDPEALLPPPGGVLEVVIGRALLTGPGRRVGEPFDLAATLETTLSRAPFDVVHLHEPLAPSPALAAMRHARGITAATFHRAEPLAGVAFLRPLVDRALARADLRFATTEAGRTALSEILPGTYAVVAPGVDMDLFAPPPEHDGPPGLVLVARGRDRVGVRFALGVLRGIDLDARRRRDPAGAGGRAVAHPGRGAEGAARPGVGGPRRGPAVARGGVPHRPHRPASPRPRTCSGRRWARRWRPAARCWRPSAPRWTKPRCTGSTPWCCRPSRATPGAAPSPSWSPTPRAAGRSEQQRAPARACAPGTTSPRTSRRRTGRRSRSAHATRGRARGACGPTSTSAPAPTSRRRRSWPPAWNTALRWWPSRAPAISRRRVQTEALAVEGVSVIVSQEIATSEGTLVGLYLSEPVADGLTAKDTVDAIHAQGGLALAPHTTAPAAEVLRGLAGAVDVHAIASAADEGRGTGRAGSVAAARPARRLGQRGRAARGRRRPSHRAAALHGRRRACWRPCRTPARPGRAAGRRRASP